MQLFTLRVSIITLVRHCGKNPTKPHRTFKVRNFSRTPTQRPESLCEQNLSRDTVKLKVIWWLISNDFGAEMDCFIVDGLASITIINQPIKVMATYSGFDVFQWRTYDLALAQCDTFVNSNNSIVTITVAISNGTRHWRKECVDAPYALDFILGRVWWYGWNLLCLLVSKAGLKAAPHSYCISDFLILIIAVNTGSVSCFYTPTHCSSLSQSQIISIRDGMIPKLIQLWWETH